MPMKKGAIQAMYTFSVSQTKNNEKTAAAVPKKN